MTLCLCCNTISFKLTQNTEFNLKYQFSIKRTTTKTIVTHGESFMNEVMRKYL